MKDKKEKQREKSRKLCEKLIEKQERLQKLKKEREKYKKKLENKIEIMARKKELYDRKRDVELQNIKRQREELFKRNQINKKEIEKEEELRREDILFEENNIFERVQDRENWGKRDINNIQNKTFNLFQEDIELRKNFLKQLSKLKEESVSKKSDKQKRKIYTDKLKAEAERKRKEEELRREDILFEENNIFGRIQDRDNWGKRDINNIQNKTLILFQEDIELRKNFLKQLSRLKEESVSKKSDKQKRKIYTDKLKAEAERKRKEEEERLEKLLMG
jgi:hypothetical protein